MAMATMTAGRPGPDGHRDGHGQDQIGERLQDLHHPLAHQVEAAAAGSRRPRPTASPTVVPSSTAAKATNSEVRAAVDHAAQRVAADLVGAEEGLRVGRLVHAPEVRLERLARRDQRRGRRPSTMIRPRRRPTPTVGAACEMPSAAPMRPTRRATAPDEFATQERELTGSGSADRATRRSGRPRRSPPRRSTA